MQILKKSLMGLLTLSFLCFQGLYAQEEEPKSPASQGKVYSVNGVRLSYAKENPHQVPLDLILQNAWIEVELLDGAYGLPQKGECGHWVALCDLDQLDPQKLYGSAIVSMAQSIVARLNDCGLIGVYVTVDESQISEDGKDLRKEGDHCLHLIVHAYEVLSVNTKALGCRFCDCKENNPYHAKIACCSPVQPAGMGPCHATPLLRKDMVSNYLYFLNRYPGRQVEVELVPQEDKLGVDLNYLVAEDHPWSVYVTADNTGTSATPKWIEKIGYVNRQLFGFDDTLNVEYATTRFTKYHSAKASYDFPLYCQGIRGNVAGRWSDFTSENFGIFNEKFNGTQWSVTAGAKTILYQYENTFLDLITNVEWLRVGVDNRLITGILKGHEHFLMPTLGLLYSGQGDEYNFSLYGGVRKNLHGLAKTTPQGTNLLGRASVPNSFWIFSGNLYYSFYIDCYLPDCMKGKEYCFDCPCDMDLSFLDCLKRPCCGEIEKSCEEVAQNQEQEESMQEVKAPAPLTHEIVLSADGQYSGGKRLIPQLQYVIGGFYSVRGYPQSVAAGDSGWFSQLEYRYHQYFCKKKWHLIGKVFFDAGSTYPMGTSFLERNRHLYSSGFGVDLEWNRFMRIRSDLGFALKRLPFDNVKKGNHEWHFSISFVY